MDADFNRYFSYAELVEEVNRLSKEYSDLCRVSEIGKSYEGRPIYLLTVTDFSKGEPDEKPAVYADANLHATEVAGTTVVLRIAHDLVTGFRKGDERIVRMLNKSAFYLVPRANPDGAERVFSLPLELLRSGPRKYPYPEREGGLHLADVDGDGRILQMRIPDPAGDWKVSAIDPLLMTKRAPDENGGEYYRLLAEGLLEDFDGFIVKGARAEASLDFNRNFPYSWRTEGEQYGAGPFPTSEPEVRALVDFITSHANINTALCFHTFSGLILRPYDDRDDDAFDTHDLWVYERLGDIGSQVTGYRSGPVRELLRYHPKEVITGTEDSWLFDGLGIYAFTVEIWDIVGQAGIERKDPIEWLRKHPPEDDFKILSWYRNQVPDGDAYVEWYPFNHPQLGAVELGGWNKLYSWRNPPHKLMGAEAARCSEFALKMGDVLPDLATVSFDAERIGEKVWRLRLQLENRGFLSTYTSKRALKTKTVRPISFKLTLPEGAKLVSGMARGEIGQLEGRSNKLDAATFSFISAPTDNRAKAEWTIEAEPGASISIRYGSDRSGRKSVSCVLDAG